MENEGKRTKPKRKLASTTSIDNGTSKKIKGKENASVEKEAAVSAPEEIDRTNDAMLQIVYEHREDEVPKEAQATHEVVPGTFNRKAIQMLRAQIFQFDVDENKEKIPICKLCAPTAVKIKMKNSNTTGIKRHLETFHPAEFAIIYPASAAPKQNRSKATDAFSQETFDIMVVDWTAHKYLPFTFFDDETTQEFFRYLNPYAAVPKRDALRENTLKRFYDARKAVKEIFEENSSKVSFTLDGWTSVANESYYGITGHFIDKDWNLKSVVVDFVPCFGAHSGRDIAHIFFETLKIYNLENKIQGVTVDNASANTKFMEEMASLMLVNGLKFDPVNQHFRCFAHILNLAVNDMLRLIQANININNDSENSCEDDCEEEATAPDTEAEKKSENDDSRNVLTKIRKLFIKIKYSEQWRRKLQSCCETTNLKMLSPILGVPTRWNSTFDMIESALRMRQALNLLCDNNADLKCFRISESAWSIMEMIAKDLRNFKILSTVLSGNTYVTLPLVVIGINMLLDKMEQHIIQYRQIKSPTLVERLIFDARLAARDKILKHYHKSNWIYCVSLILDPRHKLETFDLTHWGKEMAAESKEKFEEIFENEYYQPRTVETQLNIFEALEKGEVLEDEDVLDLSSLFESNTPSNSLTFNTGWRQELYSYFMQRRAEKNENILAWWKLHAAKFPTLALMARDFLSIMATSVPVERVFSRGSLIIRKHRNRLCKESARALLCLNSWVTSDLRLEIVRRIEEFKTTRDSD